MKKLLLTVSALTACLLSGIAQHIPNSSFESWGTYSYDEPAFPWVSSNLLTAAETQIITASQVAGYNSNAAIRLEAKISGDDTLPAFVANEINGLTSFTGGRPYAGATPTGVSGFIRYSLHTDDTAFLMVIFKQNGTVVGAETFNLAQSSSQASFTAFNLPMTVMATPDTVLLLCILNNLPAGGAMPKPGSWLELDSLAFETAGGPVPAEEGGFENWSTFYIDEPTDWQNGSLFGWGMPGNVTQTQDYHTGAYAASLTTIYAAAFQTTLFGTLGITVPVNTPAVDSTDSLTFYYKYSTPTPGADEGFVTIFGLDADSNILASGTMQIDTASAFTKITMPLDPISPGMSYINITFQSSLPFVTAVAGSNLIIDDVSITRTSLGIKDTKKSSLKIYPNPAQDVVYIEQSNGFDYRLVDMTGKAVVHGTIEGGQINVKQLIPGNYLLQIQDKNGNSQTSLIEKQ